MSVYMYYEPTKVAGSTIAFGIMMLIPYVMLMTYFFYEETNQYLHFDYYLYGWWAIILVIMLLNINWVKTLRGNGK